ncbi:MAG: hypothetical protein GF364_01315 [Candidatus Lokiarchaeota archaeon]|nr:hypothetical protein [Candidatus Lokiarchaeota archaeon]
MKYYFIIFFAIIGPYCLNGQTIYVQSDHWVYDYLDRLETLKIIPAVHNGTLPMTRSKIAGYLRFISKSPNQFEKLNNLDQEQFYYLLIEFQDELEDFLENQTMYDSCFFKWLHKSKMDPIIPDFIYKNNRNLFSFINDPLIAYWDPIFFRSRLFADTDTSQAREYVFQDTNGFRLWGFLGRYVGFMVDVRDTREWGSRQYPNQKNYTEKGLGFVQGNGDFIYHDETRAYSVVSSNHFSILFGKDDNRWGPGTQSQLALSDRATTYDQFRLKFHTSRITFTHVYAWLQHYQPDFFYGNYAQKALTAHRLEFTPWSWLDMGIHEVIVFSGRMFEAGYANPFMFYRSAEHYLGDRDNALIGFDFEFKAVARSKFYGEVLFDDFKASKLGSDYYGNKYAWMMGCFIADPFRLSNFEMRAEYSYIRPYTYSHENPLNSYVQYNTPLGHYLGPNAKELFVEFAFQPKRWLGLLTRIKQSSKGENTDLLNVGGNILVPANPVDYGDSAPFLEGALSKVLNIGFETRMEFLRNMWVNLSLDYFCLDREATLENPELVNSKTFQANFMLSINY